MVYKCRGNESKGAERNEWYYTGMTSGNIKARISDHQTSFKKPEQEQKTELSKIMWKNKRGDKITELNWTRVGYAQARKANQSLCNLCNLETLFIMRGSPDQINKRDEMGGYCPHKRKFLLKNIASEIKRRKEDNAIVQAQITAQ